MAVLDPCFLFFLQDHIPVPYQPDSSSNPSSTTSSTPSSPAPPLPPSATPPSPLHPSPQCTRQQKNFSLPGTLCLGSWRGGVQCQRRREWAGVGCAPGLAERLVISGGQGGLCSGEPRGCQNQMVTLISCLGHQRLCTGVSPVWAKSICEMQTCSAWAESLHIASS